MSKAPTDVVERANETLEGWKTIQVNLPFGELTQAGMQASIDQVASF